MRFLGHTQLDTNSPLPPQTHTHTHTHTHTLYKLSFLLTRGRDSYLNNTRQTQERNIHAFSGVLSRDPSNQTAEDPRIKSHGHRDRIYVGLDRLNYEVSEIRMVLGFVQKQIKSSVFCVPEI